MENNKTTFEFLDINGLKEYHQLLLELVSKKHNDLVDGINALQTEVIAKLQEQVKGLQSKVETLEKQLNNNTLENETAQ